MLKHKKLKDVVWSWEKREKKKKNAKVENVF